MIDLIFQGIMINSEKIDSVMKRMNKNNTKNAIIMGLLAIDIYLITKTIKEHDKRINNIETKLKEIESKGE